jgi:hypothetical protein
VVDGGVEGDVGTASSDWMLLSDDRLVLDQPLIRQATVALPERAGELAWTDDYSNIVQVMRFWRRASTD